MSTEERIGQALGTWPCAAVLIALFVTILLLIFMSAWFNERKLKFKIRRDIQKELRNAKSLPPRSDPDVRATPSGTE